jgi:hypothetical protein
MSKKQQIQKNLKLSEELMEYLADNPYNSKEKNVSFVVFTQNDKELNKLNSNLINSLIEEGKHVIKAIQTSDKNHPWSFLQD